MSISEKKYEPTVSNHPGINSLIGVVLILGNLLINRWMLETYFVLDKSIDCLPIKIVLYLFNVFCIFLGVWLIYKRKSVDIRPYLVSFLIVAICCFFSLEFYARFKSNPTPIYEIVMIAEKFDRAKQCIKEHKKFGSRERAYCDYYLFAPDIFTSETFTITPYFFSRRVPDSYPIGKGNVIIWVLGGSTILQGSTSDELTIVNQLAFNLNKQGIKSTVFNFGEASFQSSLESIKFQDILRRVDNNERPDIVIFYDGFNEGRSCLYYGAGGLQGDLSNKLKALITRQSKILLVYSLSNILSDVSMFWKEYLKPPLDFHLFGNIQMYTDADNLVEGVEIYESNTKIIRGVCKEFGIKPFFVLQPMIFTKKPLTELEQTVYKSISEKEIDYMKSFYGSTIETMCKYNDFYNFSNILDNSKRNDFSDLGHVGPYTGIKIGFKLSEIVASELK